MRLLHQHADDICVTVAGSQRHPNVLSRQLDVVGHQQLDCFGLACLAGIGKQSVCCTIPSATGTLPTLFHTPIPSGESQGKRTPPSSASAEAEAGESAVLVAVKVVLFSQDAQQCPIHVFGRESEGEDVGGGEGVGLVYHVLHDFDGEGTDHRRS